MSAPSIYIIKQNYYNVNMNFKNILTELSNTNWFEVLLALLAGAILGFIFIKLKLPAPAPLVLAGIAGIIGIWLGYLIGK